MYALVTKEGRLVWGRLYNTAGAAKLAVRNNAFNQFVVGVAKYDRDEGKVTGEVLMLNYNTNKWEAVNND